MPHRSTVLPVALAMCVLSGYAIAQPVTRVLAVSGDASPGVSSETFETVTWHVPNVANRPSPASLNGSGSVCFFGQLSPGISTLDHYGYWKSSLFGGVELVCTNSTPVPIFGDGVRISGVSHGALNDSGMTVLFAQLEGDGVDESNDSVVLRWTAEQGLIPVVREGEVAPGVSDKPMGPVGGGLLNNRGDVLVEGYLDDTLPPSNRDQGVWLYPASSPPRLLVRRGDATPGLPGGEFRSFRSFDPAINSRGNVSLHARYAFEGLLRSGIWFAPFDGPIEQAIALGAPADSVAPGYVITRTGINTIPGVSWFAFNDRDTIACLATVTNPTTMETLDGLVRIRRVGGDVTLDAVDGFFGDGLRPPVDILQMALDANDNVFFIAELPNGQVSMRKFDGEQVHVIAGERFQVPGFPPGVVYDEISTQPFAVSPDGRLVFVVRIEGAGLTIHDDELLLLYDEFNQLSILQREGRAVDVNPDPLIDDLRIPTRLFGITGVTGAQDGRRMMFNAQGELLQELEFLDGSSAVTVTRLDGQAECPWDIADDSGTLGGDGQVSFGDFCAMLGLAGECPREAIGCAGDFADDFGTITRGDGRVSFGDFLALLRLVGPCP